MIQSGHSPPHVHAIARGGALAKQRLNCPDSSVTLVGQTGFWAAEIAGIGKAVAAVLPAMCAR
jgi:hypothetical protein